MERDTEALCVVCKSAVMEKIEREYNPMTGPLILGPASKDQFNEISKGFSARGAALYTNFPRQHLSKKGGS